MSPANNYKKIETKLIEKIVKFFRFIGGSIHSAFKFVIQKGKQRFTIMFIPHSEKKIVNFHISIFSLVFICMLISILIIGFIGFSTYFTGHMEKLNEITDDLNRSNLNVEDFENEVKRLTRSYKITENRMNELLKVLEKDIATAPDTTGRGGDLSSMDLAENMDRTSPQITELRELRNYLDSIQEPIAKLENFIKRQKELLVDTPNLWPVLGQKGSLTGFFGPEKHPIKHTFRLHNGVDIAWSRGTPLVSTANGVVESTNFNANGLGYNITIRHKYGFRTVYGHLDKIIVVRGQKVKRGDVIGYMGSTGVSTGPHVHYEVYIGEQVVDPMRFLDMNSEIVDKLK